MRQCKDRGEGGQDGYITLGGGGVPAKPGSNVIFKYSFKSILHYIILYYIAFFISYFTRLCDIVLQH